MVVSFIKLELVSLYVMWETRRNKSRVRNNVKCAATPSVDLIVYEAWHEPVHPTCITSSNNAD
jgi:hypothetical protein